MLGIGHLAAAMRVQLRTPLCGDVRRPRRDILSTGGDSERTCGVRTLVLACADFECAASFADANRRALAARTPLLFAWLAERIVKVGPWVVPFETACFECHPTQRWDFSPSDAERRFIAAVCDDPPGATGDIDAHLERLAQFGSARIAHLLQPCVRGRGAAFLRPGVGVAKFDPPSPEPDRRPWPRAPGCPACGQPGFPARGRPCPPLQTPAPVRMA